MPEATARIAAVLLAGAFTWAAVAKILAFARWRAVLARYGLPSPLRRTALVGVPGGEVAIAAVTLFVSARAGAAAAVGALALFSLAVLRARAINGDTLPCGCFGGTEERHYRTMLWRNAALGALAAIVLLAREDPVGAGTELTRPSGPDLLPAILVVVGGAVMVWMAWQVASAFRRREEP
jgi:hypothetical protein